MPPATPKPPPVPPGHEAVTLTIRPGEVHHAPADEVPVLRQQGLLIEDTPAAPASGKDPA